MSGGHFYPEYCYHQVTSFVDEVEEAIRNNGKVNEDGYKYDYDPDVIDYIEEQLPKMRKMAEIMRACDYLYAGDHGSDSFLLKVKEIEAKYSFTDPLQQILNDPNDNLNDRIADALQQAAVEFDT
jgi:hypothetical protein